MRNLKQGKMSKGGLSDKPKNKRPFTPPSQGCKHGNYHCQTCEIEMLGYVIEELRNENEQIKNAYADREGDIESLEKLLKRVHRDTTDYATKLAIERAFTITD